MKLTALIKNIIYWCLPLCYMSYIIYMRLILVRDARILYIPLSKTQILITVIIIICLLLRIYILLKQQHVFKDKTTKHTLFVWLMLNLNRISRYIKDIWIEFYHKFTRYSLKFNLLILNLVQILYHKLNLVIGLVIISIFEILPKSLVVIAFLTDVFVYHQFYYFYKVGFLLVLPLIYIALRGILLQFYVDCYEELRSFMDITVDPKQTELSYRFKDDVVPPDYIKDITDFMENHYLPVSYIPNLVLHLDSIKTRYKLRWIFIFILLLHLFGWLSILFFGIFI